MAKYVITGTPQKIVGKYLKVVQALNELHALGEETGVHWCDPAINGLTGSIVQDDTTGEWRFVQE